MIEIGVAAFKARCLAYLEEVRQKKERLLITKRGKPIASVQPYQPDDKPHRPLEGAVLFEKDIISPLREEWEEGAE